jgi:hypothetical protein
MNAKNLKALLDQLEHELDDETVILVSHCDTSAGRLPRSRLFLGGDWQFDRSQNTLTIFAAEPVSMRELHRYIDV